MYTLQRVFWEKLFILVEYANLLEMNKAILIDSFCMSLIKARKLLKDDYPYSNILEIDLVSTDSLLKKNVLDIIEKRMCINFSSEFIDLIYYQSFENC